MGHNERDRTTPDTFSVSGLESAPLVMPGTARSREMFEIVVPDDVIPSRNGGSFRNRFMHPFTVVVT